MTGVYETDDGQTFDTDEVQRKSRCDFCGQLGNVPDGDDFIDGDLPSLSGEGIHGDRADICRGCLLEGVSEEDLNEELGSVQEIREEAQSEEVELA